MAVNKVIYDGDTLIDLTEDTVTPGTLAQGVTAHDQAGNAIVGTMQAGGSDEVYVGPEEPQDENVKLWIDSDAAPDELLQPATADRLGGVKIGSGINIGIDGTISVPEVVSSGDPIPMDGCDGTYSVTVIGKLCISTLTFNSELPLNEAVIATLPMPLIPFSQVFLLPADPIAYATVTINDMGELTYLSGFAAGNMAYPAQIQIIYPCVQ